MATVERIEAVNPTVNAIVAMDVDARRRRALPNGRSQLG